MLRKLVITLLAALILATSVSANSVKAEEHACPQLWNQFRNAMENGRDTEAQKLLDALNRLNCL